MKGTYDEGGRNLFNRQQTIRSRQETEDRKTWNLEPETWNLKRA